MATTGRLFFTDSERDADLYYLTRFLAGDPFLFLELDGKKTLFLGDLEVDRAKRQARVDEVVRLAEITEALKKDLGAAMPSEPIARTALTVRRIATERGVDAFEVPASFPVALADALRGHGLGVRWCPAPFVPERQYKEPQEVEKIRAAIRLTEDAMRLAIDLIRRSDVRDGALYREGEPLTSERVRAAVNVFLVERNCHPYDVIVAGGDQGVDPHERGFGPLRAAVPIILDIFPRHNPTRYHGDMTRTVVKGRATDRVHAMFQAVRAAKACAESMLRDDADGHAVHDAVKQTFVDAGFETGQKDGRMQGFFHGTGHGLGLEVHEYPRLGAVHERMRAGHVVTVEPGLYYLGDGGVRIEDDVLVTKDGCENLCQLEAVLEV